MIFTWANLLTFTRLVVSAPMAWCMTQGLWHVAFGLFWLAVVSDFYDGRVARKLQQSSNFGGVADHGTDALFVTIGAGAAAATGYISLMLPVLIPLAFAQYALDSRVLRGKPLVASMLGRWNGIGYYVVLGVCIGMNALALNLQLPLTLLVWLLVATTLISMLDRARNYFGQS